MQGIKEMVWYKKTRNISRSGAATQNKITDTMTRRLFYD